MSFKSIIILVHSVDQKHVFYLQGVYGLQCHECGIMTDGTTMMGLKGFDNCQFFEHDVAENRSMYLRQCPPEDSCCFTLREHMAVEFWGHQGEYIWSPIYF